MSDLVVKDNALIQASYTLDLVEQRLILLAIIEARNSGQGISHDSLLRVHASQYAKRFGVNDKTAYTVLKDASKGMFERYVTYHDKNPKNGKDRSFHCRWVDKIGYEKDSGVVYLRFTPDVVPLITRLENQFTSYEIERIAKLTSGYAVRLYELLIQWRNQGGTPRYSIDDLRNKLGVELDKYKELYNLKIRVIDVALTQVNEHTDITATYEQHKAGRKISGISFKFKQKQTAEKLVSGDSFIKLTPKQIELFSRKLAGLNELGSLAPMGASTEQFAAMIADDLKDAGKQKRYIQYLHKVGYQKSSKPKK